MKQKNQYYEKAAIIRIKIKDGEHVDQPRTNSFVLL